VGREPIKCPPKTRPERRDHKEAPRGEERSIDEVIGLNQNHKKQLCEIDYVISFLEEKGQAEAAGLIREYGGRK